LKVKQLCFEKERVVKHSLYAILLSVLEGIFIYLKCAKVEKQNFKTIWEGQTILQVLICSSCGGFVMGELSNIIPDILILNDIWLCIQAIYPIENKVALLFNMRMLNSSWKQLVKNNEDQFDH
jgi:hypothetical protein